MEALHEALAQEVKAFGIKVTLVEPGAYATDFGKSGQIADVLEPYVEFRKQFLTHLANVERGDPKATAEAVLKLVDADNPPLRLGLGTSILPRARAAYAERLATWEAWEDVSNAAMGEPKKTMAGWIEQLAKKLRTRHDPQMGRFSRQARRNDQRLSDDANVGIANTEIKQAIVGEWQTRGQSLSRRTPHSTSGISTVH